MANIDDFLQSLNTDKEFQLTLRQNILTSTDNAKFESFINSNQFDKVLTAIEKPTPADQTLGQRLTTPIRGIRGLAVGAERVARGTGLLGQALLPGTAATPEQAAQVAAQAPIALERAAEAVRPGFEPEDVRETVAANVAEIGAITLFTAPLGGAGATGRLASVFKQIPAVFKNALVGGAATAVTSAVDKGDVDAVDVGTGVFIGGAALPIIGIAARTTARLGRAITRLLGAGVLKQIQPTSVRAIERAPIAKIIDTYVTNPVKATRNAVINIQTQTARVHSNISKRLNATRSKIGLGAKIDEDILTASPDFTPENPDNLVESFAVLTAPATKRSLEAPAHLRSLIKLKQDLSGFVSFNKKLSAAGQSIKLTKSGQRLLGNEEILRNTLRKIDTAIKTIPGGNEQLRMNKIWSSSKKIYDNVTKKILDDQQGPSFLRKVLLGDNLAELTLPKSDLAVLKKLERQAGTKFIDEFKTTAALLDADDATVRGNILGLIANVAGPRNTGIALRSGQILVNMSQSLSNVLNSPITVAQIAAALQQTQRR